VHESISCRSGQSVLVAFQQFAANLRKIDEFLARREVDVKQVRRLPSRRCTQSLATWAPERPPYVGATTEGATDDLDPPLTA